MVSNVFKKRRNTNSNWSRIFIFVVVVKFIDKNKIDILSLVVIINLKPTIQESYLIHSFVRYDGKIRFTMILKQTTFEAKRQLINNLLSLSHFLLSFVIIKNSIFLFELKRNIFRGE